MDLRWHKSSFSEQPDGNCIEIASDGDDVLLRESDDPELAIRTTSRTLRALLAHTRLRWDA